MKYYKWLLLFGVLLSYFISPYLPVSWGWENSVLEWLQVVILTFGLVLTFMWWQEARMAGDIRAARFLIWAVPLWALMIGRELSWGRVFYPSGFHPIDGPLFLPLSQLPYGAVVNPLIALIIVVWLWAVIKYDLLKMIYRLVKEHKFPVAVLVITVFAFVSAELGERYLHLQNMEEFDELFAYLGLILTAYSVKDSLRKLI